VLALVIASFGGLVDGGSGGASRGGSPRGGVSFCISGHISQTVWGERNTSLPGRSRDGLL